MHSFLATNLIKFVKHLVSKLRLLLESVSRVTSHLLEHMAVIKTLLNLSSCTIIYQLLHEMENSHLVWHIVELLKPIYQLEDQHIPFLIQFKEPYSLESHKRF